MEILALPESTQDVDVDTVLKLGPEDGAAIDVGVASFSAGIRNPENGYSVHEQHEVSLLLEGEFVLETPHETRTVRAGQIIHFLPGEEHAATATCKSKVFFVLFGPPTAAG